jgi:N-acyl-D-amino-acid deacylase
VARPSALQRRTIFRGATVVDGTGNPSYRAEVVIVGDRIESIRDVGAGEPADAGRAELPVADWGELPGAGSGGLPGASGESPAASRVVDATGFVLAPGFIDLHAHSDLAVLSDRDHLAKLSQGVTTEVLGQDGIGYAPVDDGTLASIRRQIRGWNGDPPIDYDWRDVGGYLERLDRGIPTNAAVLVPQGNLRMLTVGHDRRDASTAELDRMRGILKDGLDAGAVGMSSGLTYTPGMYASTAELETLCRVVAEAGGYFAPHIRSYGVGALDAYAEVIGIARRSGCALHLTHATLNFATNRDAAPAFLHMVDEALAAGVDLTLDSYPYLPGATTLSALLPSWFGTGGPDALLEALSDDSCRAVLTEAFDAVGSDGFHGEIADWSAIGIAGVTNPTLAPYVGRTVAQIAESEGRAPVDVVVDILRADELATSILMYIGHEHNVRAIMKHRVHCGGSDAILVGERPHPRAWGTFPRYLARYVRESGVLGLEECVHHLTGNPARRLGLADRGLLREGFAADLVLFDPDTILDTATFESPRQQAQGIRLVMVNGEIALEDGTRTAALSGRALRAVGSSGAGIGRATSTTATPTPTSESRI